MKTRIKKDELILLINNRATHIAAKERLNQPCAVGDIQPASGPGARANWTWDQAYRSSSVKAAEIVGRAIDEFQKTHDVEW